MTFATRRHGVVSKVVNLVIFSLQYGSNPDSGRKFPRYQWFSTVRVPSVPFHQRGTRRRKMLFWGILCCGSSLCSFKREIHRSFFKNSRVVPHTHCRLPNSVASRNGDATRKKLSHAPTRNIGDGSQRRRWVVWGAAAVDVVVALFEVLVPNKDCCISD